MDQGRPGGPHPQGQRDGHPHRLHRGLTLRPVALGQRLAWHGFAFDLPPGWEVTAYRLNPARGEFAFHERLRERAQLIWVRLSARPDLEATLRDMHARMLGVPDKAPRILRVGPFAVAHGAAGEPFQAVAFVDHDQRLLHWNFPAWAGDAPDAPWRLLLESASTQAGDEREWALFGLRVLLPRACEPREVEAQPGAVRIEFARRDGLEVTARRLAMARRLLAERPLGARERLRLVQANSRVEELVETRFAGHPAAHCDFTVRGERPWDRVAWRRWRGESWTWHDEAANRICALEQVGPPAAPRLDLARVWPMGGC